MSRQHFQVSKGLTVTPVTARPSDPQNGDIIYNSTTSSHERYENGAWKALRHVSFVVTKSGGTTNGGSTINTFTTAEEDTHSGFNLSAGTYTIPVDGAYIFKFNLAWSAPQTTSTLIVKNGGSSEQYGGNVTGSPGANYNEKLSYFGNCVVGDVISVVTNSASSLNLDSSHFCGYKVS